MLFKDRLEIWSPGPLPKGMTLAKMYKRHKSYPANPLLAYAMFLRKYVEQTGTGTGDIIARCREWGLPDGTLKKAKRIRKVGGKRFGHWEVIV